MSGAVLEAADLRVSFGGVHAVDGVSVQLAERTVLGLIGPNGSGKTSLLNAMTGVVPTTGRLYVGGDQVPLNRPERIRAAGVVRTFQAPQVLADLTCLDNALLSPSDRRGTGVISAWLGRPWQARHEERRRATALDALATVGLADHAERSAGTLTYGQQRLLELARALAGEPRVLLLDEPSAGLNDDETRSLTSLLRIVQERGISMLLVDHKVDFIDELCDRVLVLELGRRVSEGSPAEIWADARVRDAYLGGSAGA